METTAPTGEAESAREERLRLLIAAGYENIIAVGFRYARSVGKLAKANPHVKFAIVDDASPDSTGRNIENIMFAEHEGAFLAGVTAALKSRSGHIGILGGVKTDYLMSHVAGFTAGAKAVRPTIRIDVSFVTEPPDFSGFADGARTEGLATAIYRKGVDVIFYIGSSDGVFRAAKSAGAWVIGADIDHAKTAPPELRGVILTSIVKRVDVGVYDFIASLRGSTPTSGVKMFGVSAGGLDIATTGGMVDDIKQSLDGYRTRISTGELVVPRH
jgi:basic membrane protein A